MPIVKFGGFRSKIDSRIFQSRTKVDEDLIQGHFFSFLILRLHRDFPSVFGTPGCRPEKPGRERVTD